MNSAIEILQNAAADTAKCIEQRTEDLRAQAVYSGQMAAKISREEAKLRNIHEALNKLTQNQCEVGSAPMGLRGQGQPIEGANSALAECAKDANPQRGHGGRPLDGRY